MEHTLPLWATRFFAIMSRCAMLYVYVALVALYLAVCVIAFAALLVSSRADDWAARWERTEEDARNYGGLHLRPGPRCVDSEGRVTRSPGLSLTRRSTARRPTDRSAR